MTAPVAESNPDFIRRQAIRVMLARERHLIGLWASLLAKYDRVLVIYGAGHFMYDRAILEDLFDCPLRDIFEAPSPAPRLSGNELRQDYKFFRKFWVTRVFCNAIHRYDYISQLRLSLNSRNSR